MFLWIHENSFLTYFSFKSVRDTLSTFFVNLKCLLKVFQSHSAKWPLCAPIFTQVIQDDSSARLHSWRHFNFVVLQAQWLEAQFNKPKFFFAFSLQLCILNSQVVSQCSTVRGPSTKCSEQTIPLSPGIQLILFPDTVLILQIQTSSFPSAEVY